MLLKTLANGGVKMSETKNGGDKTTNTPSQPKTKPYIIRKGYAPPPPPPQKPSPNKK